MKAHFKDITCMDFYNFTKEQVNLLKEIQPSKKYEKYISSVCPGLTAQ
jgi:hypothetical protein